MPLVRISHAADLASDFPAKASQAVHRALVGAFAVPNDDFFQIVTSHEPGVGIVGPEQFLGIAHSRNIVFVQITCAEGRTTEQKKNLYVQIADGLAATAAVRREDVVINLVETKRENWSFGNGLAPFA